MKAILSAMIALMVLTGAAGSASAFDFDDDRESIDETFSSTEGQGR
jgi:hypothetical protein